MNNSTIWTEKYRPKTFKEIKGQEAIVNRVEGLVKKKNIPHLMFAGPAGVGKCVCPETLILDQYGNLLSIKEAYKKRIKGVLSLDKEGKINPKKINYFYKGFSKETYEICSNFGGNIKVSPEHPFLVLEEGKLKWIEARYLKKSMKIASPSNINVKNFKEYSLTLPKNFRSEKDYYFYHNNGRDSCKIKIPKLDKYFYYWLGMVFGDGNFKNSSVRFYNKDVHLRNKFEELSYKLFGEKIEIKSFLVRKNPYLEIRKATTIVKLLESNLDHPICCKKSDVIKVPKELYTSKLENCACFLRGLYESDGSFYSSFVEIASMSKELLIGLRYLLLKFGIQSRIKPKRILVSGSEEIKKFMKNINPSVKKPYNLKKNNTNVDVLTINRKDILLLIDTFGISYSDLGNSFFHILERGRGSRLKVQELYKKIISIVSDKISFGIESISIFNSAEQLNINPNKVFELLKESKFRNEVGIMRTDRLKEFYDQKRSPQLSNYLKIVKQLSYLKVCSEGEYKNVVNLLSIRQRVIEILNIFNISYLEISKKVSISASSVNHILNNDGLSLESVNNLKSIYCVLKEVVEGRIFNEKYITILENIGYLSNAHIVWDEIKSIKKTGQSEVYDLNVNETHNFIGGTSPLVLHNSTLALVIATEMFGDRWRDNFLELNASDERGIDVVRETIKNFARIRSISTDVPKIIFLDECDSLTREAQQALRRTMENYTKTTRFILSCNFSSKILDPIQSRCSVFRFKPLDKKSVLEMIDKIAKEEKIKIEENAKEVLFEVCEGDMRKLQNILQSCASIDDKIDDKIVYEVVNYAKPKEIKEILELSVKGEFVKAKDLMIKMKLEHGLSGLDVVKQLQKEIWNLDLNNERKLRMIEGCGRIEFRLVEGSDEYIQLEALLASFSK